ncbi:MAG: class I SAM-dependent methyltransferase [Anaerolineales bacterium]|nr:class I SAM-dependent methyltransferase [Anaerolineales bacterium]MCW5855419.1 class I SAM-dependent methyltransferase [Anaerolineales bacterium]
MKQYRYKNREEYIDAQVVRSRNKFGYCKVYFTDLVRYKRLLSLHQTRQQQPSISGAILCLGVRSGAEVDMFRATFYGPLMRLHTMQEIARRADRSKHGEEKIRLAKRLGIGSGNPHDGRVWGVEINPDAAREDIHVGSFDDLPKEWTGKFQLLYSNSFDHSVDPQRTISEWKRVAAPGAYIMIGFAPGTDASHTDPLGGMTITQMIELWQLPVVFASETLNRGGYHEICFQMS